MQAGFAGVIDDMLVQLVKTLLGIGFVQCKC